jgi:hypothetical protein
MEYILGWVTFTIALTYTLTVEPTMSFVVNIIDCCKTAGTSTRSSLVSNDYAFFAMFAQIINILL